MTEKQKIALIERFFHLVASNDFAAIAALTTTDFRFWGNGVGDFQDKLPDLLNALADYIPRGMTFSFFGWTIQDDRVAVEATSYAELKNGSIYNNSYHFLIVLREDRIALVKEYGDTQHMFQILTPVFDEIALAQS